MFGILQTHRRGRSSFTGPTAFALASGLGYGGVQTPDYGGARKNYSLGRLRYHFGAPDESRRLPQQAHRRLRRQWEGPLPPVPSPWSPAGYLVQNPARLDGGRGFCLNQSQFTWPALRTLGLSGRAGSLGQKISSTFRSTVLSVRCWMPWGTWGGTTIMQPSDSS